LPTYLPSMMRSGVKEATYVQHVDEGVVGFFHRIAAMHRRTSLWGWDFLEQLRFEKCDVERSSVNDVQTCFTKSSP